MKCIFVWTQVVNKLLLLLGKRKRLGCLFAPPYGCLSLCLMGRGFDLAGTGQVMACQGIRAHIYAHLGHTLSGDGDTGNSTVCSTACSERQ